MGIQLPAPLTGEIAFTGVKLSTPFTGESGPSTLNVIPTGGVVLGGGATIANNPFVMTGGAVVSGAATIVVEQTTHAEIYPLGGFKFSGSAVVSSKWLEHHPSGGFKLGGAAALITAERGTGGIQLTGSAVIGALTATLAATLPKLTGNLTAETVEVVNGDLAASLPSITGTLEASTGCVATITATLPRPTASLTASTPTFDAVLPHVTASLTALTGTTGSVAANLPRVTASVTGVVGSGAGISATLPSIKGGLTGITGVVGAISATLGKTACSLTASTGTSGTIGATLPRMTCEILGAQVVQATMNVRLPSISAQLTAEFVEQLIMTFVTNTLTAASTTFSDYPFNSFAEIDGKYYAAGPTGLYQIDVPQEDVPYKMTGGFCSHKMPMQKHASDFYMNMHSAGDITLKVAVDEGPQYSYVLSPEDISLLRQRRTLLGKGLRGVYWQFEVSGTKDFDFDNYTVAFAPTARRV